jgi:hypothetical protein
MTGTYAKDTTVTADRSKQEIERTLQRYGADQFMYGWKGDGAVIAFRVRQTMYRVNIPMPSRTEPEFTRTPTNRPRSVEQSRAAWEQAQRQRWRAAALYIKATLEAVEAGITTLEQAMLGSMLLSDGQTFSEWAGPQVEQMYLSGRMPQLLPGLPSPREED